MKRKILYVLLSICTSVVTFGESFEPMEGFVDAEKAVPEAAQYYKRNAEKKGQIVYALWYDSVSAKDPYNGIASQISIQNPKSVDVVHNITPNDWQMGKTAFRKEVPTRFRADNMGVLQEGDLQVLFSNDQGGQIIESEDSIAFARKMDVECDLGYISQKVNANLVFGMIYVKRRVYSIMINQTKAKSLKDTLSLFSECVKHIKNAERSTVINESQVKELNFGKYDTRWTSTGLKKANGLEVQVDLPSILEKAKEYQPHTLAKYSTYSADRRFLIQVMFTVNPIPEGIATVIKAYDKDEPLEIDKSELADFFPKSSGISLLSASLIRKAGVSGLETISETEKKIGKGQTISQCARSYTFPATKGRAFRIVITMSSLTNKITKRELDVIDPMCRLILNSLTFLKPAQFDVHKVLGKSCGTAWFVSSDLLVTCAHVIGDYEDISFKNGEGESITCRVVAKDEFQDLAVLRAMKPTKSYLRIGADPCLAEDIFTLGYPNPDIMGTTIKYTTGVVSATTGLQGDPLEYQFTAPVQPGNSGGPLFDSSGKVVGIVVSRLETQVVEACTEREVQNVNFAIKISALKSLLKKNNLSLPNDKVCSLPVSSRSKLVAELEKAVVLLIFE